MSTDVKLAMVLACSALLAACAQEQPQATASPAPAQAAGVPGPYDGTWEVDAPAAGSGTTVAGFQACAPLRLRFDVKNSQIIGSIGRATSGVGVQVSQTGADQTPMSGTVAADGTFTSTWENYTANGKLGADNKAEMHWTGTCGPRTALGGRDMSNAPLAGSSRPPFAKSFGVLFATNSAKLSDESRSVVKEAAAAAKDNAPAHITVGGHTDTVGSASFNQKLSDRRADAVRKELIANGVAPGDISTSAHGESDLAVPTADNVNEPRNRRVTIQVQQTGV